MRLLLAILLTLSTLRGLAITFTVTTNADSGPGSLRDAITQAVANGSTNTIVFNIADQSRSGRTITLASALPALPSNLTIDGTTQPGTPVGISAARIIITSPFALEYVNYFEMIGVSNVQIYGLFLQAVVGGYCFHFREASNLTFGAPNKGNIIQGFAQAFDCDYVSGTDATTTGVTIQGNIMGTDESGTTTSPAELNGIDFWLRNIANLQIGGLNTGAGNLMNEQDYVMDYTDTRNENFGYLNIQGNMQGTDFTGNIRVDPGFTQFGINGYNNGTGNPTGNNTLAINITDNVSVGGFVLDNIASKFIVQGNHLGVGLNNTTDISNTMGGNVALLNLASCSQGLIGGPNAGDKNYIAYTAFGVEEFDCGPITISQNSFFCNYIGIELGPAYPYTIPYANITLLTAGMVGGTGPPNSTIELFYDDECPGCEGKTYIGTTTADNNGNWSYTLTATGAIVVTATDVNGSTSAFSTATINTDNIVVTNATCERNNGSIKNIQVTSGTQWYWQDANGNIIANSVDLTGVGPGTYTFVTSIGGETCNASSTPYTIKDVDPPAFDPTAITLTQPTCGQNSGSLAYAGAFDPSTTYSWLSATPGPGGSSTNTVVCPDFSTADPLTKLGPGTYTLQLALKQDATCFTQYGPYTLTNQAGPTVTVSGVNINPSTCSLPNGSITGITYQNATPPVYLMWRNAQGAGVSNQPNLEHAYADSYQLVFKDASSCVDTIFSPWYTLPDNGTITYDTTKLVYTPATCDLDNGALTGITATNATNFIWTNGDGNVVGTALNLSGLAPGPYELSLSDAYGCQVSILPPFTIRQIPLPAFDYGPLQQYDDTCNSGVGAIKDLAMVDSTRTYSWSWYNVTNTTTPIATTAGYLDGLHAGTYYATVADQYACAVTTKTLAIGDVELSPPMPQVPGAYIARNTSTVLTVTNPQTGEYLLLDGPSYGATILDSSASGALQTPNVPQDETLYVGFVRGDCSGPIAPVNIKVFDSVRIFVPNAFTPNGDGANDTWHIIIQGLTKKIQISVFDRWGAMVFSSNDPNMSWDGTAGGHQLSGTFVYMIGGIDYFNKPFLLKGTLMIIR